MDDVLYTYTHLNLEILNYYYLYIIIIYNNNAVGKMLLGRWYQ